MVHEDNANKILIYLKRQGQTNTFKLATELGINRDQVLNIIKELEEKRAVKVYSGIVKFLRFNKEQKDGIKKVPIKLKGKEPKKFKLLKINLPQKFNPRKFMKTFLKKQKRFLKKLAKKTIKIAEQEVKIQ